MATGDNNNNNNEKKATTKKPKQNQKKENHHRLKEQFLHDHNHHHHHHHHHSRLYQIYTTTIVSRWYMFVHWYSPFCITFTYMITMTLYFIFMIYHVGGISAHPIDNPMIGPNAVDLYYYGMLIPADVIYNNNKYHSILSVLFTSMFVCSGFISYIITMIVLWTYGRSLEVYISEQYNNNNNNGNGDSGYYCNGHIVYASMGYMIGLIANLLYIGTNDVGVWRYGSGGEGDDDNDNDDSTTTTTSRGGANSIATCTSLSLAMGLYGLYHFIQVLQPSHNRMTTTTTTIRGGCCLRRVFWVTIVMFLIVPAIQWYSSYDNNIFIACVPISFFVCWYMQVLLGQPTPATSRSSSSSSDDDDEAQQDHIIIPSIQQRIRTFFCCGQQDQQQQCRRRQLTLCLLTLCIILVVIRAMMSHPNKIYLKPYYTSCHLMHANGNALANSNFIANNGGDDNNDNNDNGRRRRGRGLLLFHRSLEGDDDDNNKYYNLCAEFCIPNIIVQMGAKKYAMKYLNLDITYDSCLMANTTADYNNNNNNDDATAVDNTENTEYQYVADRTYHYFTYSLDVTIYKTTTTTTTDGGGEDKR